jgi:hypothetical protein
MNWGQYTMIKADSNAYVYINVNYKFEKVRR